MAEYTIREEGGCTFIFGDGLPLDALAALTSGKSTKGKAMAPHLARLAGAIFAWGKPQDVAAATEKYTPIALARVQQNATPEMLALGKEAIRWLAIGRHGMSACSIFWKTTGVKPDLIRSIKDPQYPLDPDDLGRCRNLLEQVHIVWERFTPVMRTMAGPVWAALVEHWGCLCATMDREAPDWREGKGSAPETYRIMQEII